MGRLVPKFGEGGSVGIWLKFGLYTFFCLMTRPIILPEIFKSGKKIGLDPLAVVTQASSPSGTVCHCLG
jgi:hypothetical protein